MIKTTAILIKELHDYSNPQAKIRKMLADKLLIHVVRGIYETNLQLPGYCLAGIIYGPSYLSFEYALAYHHLIPEAVFNYTCATFEKRRTKSYTTPFGVYLYRDIPSKAYPLGIEYHNEAGYAFQLATAEKAICDQLYILPPLSNIKQLEFLLFNDLRIYEDEWQKLDFQYLAQLASIYHCSNHKLLVKYIRRLLRKSKVK